MDISDSIFSELPEDDISYLDGPHDKGPGLESIK